MANPPKKEEAVEEQPKGKGKKKLIILLASIFLIVLLGGVGAFVVMKKKNAEDAGDEEVVEETETPAKKTKTKNEGPPVFSSLEAITVNLLPDESGQDRYLQTQITLELEDPHAEADVKTNMPKIKNNLTLLLSSKKPTELIKKEDKEKLSLEITESINLIINPPKKDKKGKQILPEGPIKSALFISFIVQ